MKTHSPAPYLWSVFLPIALAVLVSTRLWTRSAIPTPTAPAPTQTRVEQSVGHPKPVPTVLPILSLPALDAGIPVPELGVPGGLISPLGSPKLRARPDGPPSPPIVDAQLEAAKSQLRDGEIDAARAQLRWLAQATALPVAARAQFVFARSLLLTGDDAAARQAFVDYLSRFPRGADAPAAKFAVGHLALADGQISTAASYLQDYLESTADHALDGYALLDLARIDRANGNSDSALARLRQAINAGIPLSEEMKAASDIAIAQEQGGHFAAAADWYASLAQRPENDPATRSRYRVLQATDLLRAGRAGEAIDILLPLLDTGTLDTQVGFVIDALGRAGHPLSPFAAGEAYLKARQYDRAVAALGDYLDHNPDGPDAATARFDRGRALMGQTSYAAAAEQFARFLQTAPADPRVGEAALLEGEALARSGDSARAVSFLLGFARQHPNDPRAAQALLNAVGYLQKDSQPEAAQQVEQQLVDSFPSSPLVAKAAFDLGWAAYERLDFSTARTFWQMVRDRWPNAPTSAPALLWLGKIEQREGNLAAARRDYDLAWKASPGDYYSFRARQLAASLATPNPTTEVQLPTAEQLTRERTDLESWLASWTEPTADERHLPYLGAPISRGTTLARIRALADLGFTEEVDAEVKNAMNQFSQDGRSLYALADTLDQAGLTRASLGAAYQLLMISPAPNAYQAPVYLQRLVYPFPYRNLIISAARAHGVDPLLLVSLIRQESAFNTRARSPSNAIGLTQFMPGTAQAVAAQLGMTTFRMDDLLRPSIAIRLGAAYLATEIKAFGGNPFIALAAYNAGEGNVRQWLADNPRRDLDLFVEEIPFHETSEYVRNIYRFYQEYQYLYGGQPAS